MYLLYNGTLKPFVLKSNQTRYSTYVGIIQKNTCEFFFMKSSTSRADYYTRTCGIFMRNNTVFTHMILKPMCIMECILEVNCFFLHLNALSL